MDWSQNGESFRTWDSSGELLYYDVSSANGKEFGRNDTGGASRFRDEPWDTSTCVMSWASQGIWKAGMDGSDINHCDRNHDHTL